MVNQQPQASAPRKILGIKVPFGKKSQDSSADDHNLPKPGENLQLDGFGGEVEMTDGERATLRNLVDISVGGVIIFTYPKANTPACQSIPSTRTLLRHESTYTRKLTALQALHKLVSSATATQIFGMWDSQFTACLATHQPRIRASRFGTISLST